MALEAGLVVVVVVGAGHRAAVSAWTCLEVRLQVVDVGLVGGEVAGLEVRLGLRRRRPGPGSAGPGPGRQGGRGAPLPLALPTEGRFTGAESTSESATDSEVADPPLVAVDGDDLLELWERRCPSST